MMVMRMFSSNVNVCLGGLIMPEASQSVKTPKAVYVGANERSAHESVLIHYLSSLLEMSELILHPYSCAIAIRLKVISRSPSQPFCLSRSQMSRRLRHAPKISCTFLSSC
eukprot:Blabericola_migrator_1__4408@NODE_2366_length_2868_cov_821_664049_g1483_i0_p4_GENE_NODE_2366_length_2868_cov_821_664049_g1483_i0NODE_2366_length_2868_cov_821_664049_g1483_i0_p4_ORF_typecomplete_len110_score15_22_NODE_2366_length_2868_cov_821_664049_g1483_i0353682